MLRDLIQQIASKYPAYRSHGIIAKADFEVHAAVEQDLPNALRDLLPEQSHYKIQGSCGAGNVTAAPWIATFDRRITESAQHGYYIVYLFSVDLKSIYLSLGIGVTSFRKYYGEGKKSNEQILSAATRLADFLPETISDLHLGRTDLSAGPGEKLHRGYELGNVAAIRYEIDNLPADDRLQDDYARFLELYERLVLDPTVPDPEALLEASIVVPEKQEPESIPFTPREPRGPRSGTSGSGRGRRYSKESRKIGDKGEELVLEHERKRLTELGRPDLATRVEWTARDRKKSPGYDIQSFEADEAPRYIEVKSSKSTSNSVDITRNEWKSAERYGDKFWLYIVSNVLKPSPRIEMMQNPFSIVQGGQLSISESVWELSLRNPDAPP